VSVDLPDDAVIGLRFSKLNDCMVSQVLESEAANAYYPLDFLTLLTGAC
jgi:hypothetical protein